MTVSGTAKSDLHRYLQEARDALLWKLEGLSEYDIRRPMTQTGTNLLGLVKHVAGIELGYLGDTFGRPSGEPLPWLADAAETNADMWATAEESRAFVVDLYRRAWAHADATLYALPLDTTGRVPWWPDERSELTLHHAGSASSPTPNATPATPTSSGNCSTAVRERPRPRRASRRPTRPGGRPTANGWSRRPGRRTATADVRGLSHPASTMGQEAHGIDASVMRVIEGQARRVVALGHGTDGSTRVGSRR